MSKVDKQTGVHVKLIGEDGNVFNLINLVKRALISAGHKELAEEMQEAVMSCGSYDEALVIFTEYVEVE